MHSKRPRSYEDFEPSFELSCGEESDILLVNLPGFKKEQVKLQVDSHGTLRTIGQCPLDSNRWRRFWKDFRMPPNFCVDDIRAIFENEILFITLPKYKASIKPIVPNQKPLPSKQVAAPPKLDTAPDKRKPAYVPDVPKPAPAPKVPKLTRALRVTKQCFSPEFPEEAPSPEVLKLAIAPEIRKPDCTFEAQIPAPAGEVSKSAPAPEKSKPAAPPEVTKPDSALEVSEPTPAPEEPESAPAPQESEPDSATELTVQNFTTKISEPFPSPEVPELSPAPEVPKPAPAPEVPKPAPAPELPTQDPVSEVPKSAVSEPKSAMPQESIASLIDGHTNGKLWEMLSTNVDETVNYKEKGTTSQSLGDKVIKRKEEKRAEKPQNDEPASAAHRKKSAQATRGLLAFNVAVGLVALVGFGVYLSFKLSNVVTHGAQNITEEAGAIK